MLVCWFHNETNSWKILSKDVLNDGFAFIKYYYISREDLIKLLIFLLVYHINSIILYFNGSHFNLNYSRVKIYTFSVFSK